MGLALDSGCQERLLAYLTLLSRWNRRYNLTAVREPEAMVTRHLLDSLSLLPFLREGSLIDVGSGAGLPGVPIALVQPRREVTVLDSNGKKTRFLDH
ncbi:MAG: 16S rRNA (guanine(527)-N(7))-methyltransferase RsmG, partial [Pseudomonadota bacterium]